MHLQGAMRYFKFLRKTAILWDAQEPLALGVHSFNIRSCCIPLMMSYLCGAGFLVAAVVKSVVRWNRRGEGNEGSSVQSDANV